jgi:methylthioribose-1-phosphate isomerase
MKVGGKDYRSIWQDEGDPGSVHVIDQRKLPFSFEVMTLRSSGEVCDAISSMAVRGAPLIGAAAAWGVYLSCLEHGNDDDVYTSVMNDAQRLKATRPTAVNLSWAVDYMAEILKNYPDTDVMRKAAQGLCDDEAERSRSIGVHGLPLIEEISRRKGGGVVNILTHCNAGWLACVDYGTALAPVYLAHDGGIKVHVWVDETRPRNQGSRLTAWELSNHGVPCTLITDNAGGHLMQNGMVDMVIVGSDRATASGDVANKTGTYLKALAASDNGIPFYAALPVSTFDMTIDHPDQIVIEERDGDEVRKLDGIDIAPENIPVSNYGFDVTPARLITAIITDRGVCRADKDSILKILA